MKDNKNKEMEMKNSSTQSNELNDDDLDNVAGGFDSARIDLEQGGQISIDVNGNIAIKPKHGEPYIINSKEVKNLYFEDSSTKDHTDWRAMTQGY